MYQPNYPQNLEQMFSSPNPFLPQMGVEQWNTAQEQAKQNLALAGQQQDVIAKKLPLELEQMKANTGLTQSQIGHSDALTKEINDRISALPPAEQRMASAKAKLYAEASEAQLKQLDAKYNKLGLFATAAESNGGKVPLALQQDEDFQSFAPFMQQPNWIKSAKTAISAHNALSPAFQQAMATAGVQANAHLQGIREQTAAQERMNKANIDAGKYRNHGDEFMQMQMLKTPTGAIQYWAIQKYGAYSAMQNAAPGSPEYMRAQAAYQNAMAEEDKATKVALGAGLNQAQVLAAKSVAMDTLNSGQIGAVKPPEAPATVNPAGGTPPPQPAASSPAKMDKAAIIKAYRDAGSTGTDQEILDYHNKTYGGK